MKRICLLVVAAILTSCQWGAVAEYLPYLMMTSPKSVKLESSGLPQYKLEKDRICFTLEVTGQKISQYYATDPFNDWDYMLQLSTAKNPRDPNEVKIVESQEYVRDAYVTYVLPGEEATRKELERRKVYDSAYYMSVKSTPTIVADGVLFGREPGTDLSDIFHVNEDGMQRQGVSVPRLCRDGDGLKIIDTPEYPELCSFADYYIPGTLIKYGMVLTSPYFPEELKTGNVVNLTVTIPVTEEHLWEYALARSKGMVVDKEYKDNILQTTIKLEYKE